MNKVIVPILLFIAVLTSSCNRDTKKPAEVEQPVDSVSHQSKQDTALATQGESHTNFSKVIGWPEGLTPQAPAGFTVTRFAGGINSPRWIYVAPNGDVFVSLANTESKGTKKIKDAISGKAQSQNTAKSPNQILLFKGGDPLKQTSFLTDLNQPFGMLILGDYFYVANTDGLWRYPYKGTETRITAAGAKILELPAGGYNNHWTRNILANKSGSKIYVSVGSASNIGEHGMDKEVRRACILEVNPDGSGEKIYASGLRNPVGMDWMPGTEVLWTAVNERDELGDELVPDYLTSVKRDGFYGWPYSYFGQHVDARVKTEDQKPELVSRAIVPDVKLQSHSASLGLAFYDQKEFPAKYHNGAFIGQHGSWNRSRIVGYKVLFVPFTNGQPGKAEDFLTGFIANEEKSEVYGRPVGVAVMKDGSLLVADDAADVLWKVDKD